MAKDKFTSIFSSQMEVISVMILQKYRKKCMHVLLYVCVNTVGVFGYHITVCIYSRYLGRTIFFLFSKFYTLMHGTMSKLQHKKEMLIEKYDKKA